MVSRALRVGWHRATTAQLSAVYPFHAEAGLGSAGVYLGTNDTAGGSAFYFDPFELYTRGVLTAPNMLVVGEVGAGKSTAVKTFLYRTLAVLGRRQHRGRWVAIIDPKGEYAALAAALGLDRIELHPGGATRINPLDPGPGEVNDESLAQRTAMVAALTATVLRRDLTPLEDALIGWSTDTVCRALTQPTLADIVAVLANPPAELVERATTTASQLVTDSAAIRYTLDRLLDRDLRGMFDGHSTVHINWHGPGLVIDLSRVHLEPDALAVVMIATTAWLQALLAGPVGDDGPRRIQVLEECWALLGNERTARYLQACWKLSRAYGVANIAVAHRISDLRAQANDGTAANKITAGLLADTQTRVLFRQSSDQITEAKTLLGLTEREATLLPQLARGRALWKIAGHSALVTHLISQDEFAICDTDARLLA
jgi:type IV secretory pathway VirB4 component